MFSVFLVSPVSAQDVNGLVVSPKRVVFESEQKITEVLLANRGGSEQKFRISVVNRAMQENGQLIEVDAPAEGEYFATDIIRYSPRMVTLGPKETQKIRVMSRLKNDAPDGEYRSHLLLQEIPDAGDAKSAGDENDGALGINISAVFGVTVPVIIRKGVLSAEASLSTPKIKKVGEDTFLELTINREGTKSFLGTLNVFADSQKIGILRNVAVYLSSERRVVSIKLDQDRAQNLSGKSIRVTLGADGEFEDAPSTDLVFTAP